MKRTRHTAKLFIAAKKEKKRKKENKSASVFISRAMYVSIN